MNEEYLEYLDSTIVNNERCCFLKLSNVKLSEYYFLDFYLKLNKFITSWEIKIFAKNREAVR